MYLQQGLYVLAARSLCTCSKVSMYLQQGLYNYACSSRTHKLKSCSSLQQGLYVELTSHTVPFGKVSIELTSHMQFLASRSLCIILLLDR